MGVLDLKTHSNFDHIACDIKEPIHCADSYTDNHIHDNVHQIFNNYVTKSIQPPAAFIDYNEAFVNISCHIDRVDLFYLEACGDTFPYYLVYLHGLNNHVNKGFYYLSVNVDDTVSFYTCENIPSGYLEVLSSELVHISYFLQECVKLLSHVEKLQAKIAYDN